ncbi:hypothetical protein [Mycobacterium kubicae]|uniref:hypothetical protein n=1 Tax=Mycobacterium kubicae TaxID=120959 RepID=UPI000ABE5C74|nr:hypothetical protein [Mycobacterium kubicae]
MPRFLMAAALLATAMTAACTVTHSGTPTTSSRVTPTVSVTAAPAPTTREQLCDAQTWPRPIPEVVGRLFNQVNNDGALWCWQNVRGVTTDGRDPIRDKTYRVTAVSPPAGTPLGRFDPVTVDLSEVVGAPTAFHPCDWVTPTEAAAIMGGPVSAKPDGDEPGSIDIGCYYDKSDDVGEGVETDLRLPGAFPVDAPSQFALATTSTNVTNVDGMGLQAVCVHEATTTPPSTTLVVLLSEGRLFRVTEGYASCDKLRRFARLAIGRIGA